MSEDDKLFAWESIVHIAVTTVWFLVILVAVIIAHGVVTLAERHGWVPPWFANIFNGLAYVIAFLDILRFGWYILTKPWK